MGYWEWKEWATGSGGNRRWVRERKDCRWATESGRIRGWVREREDCRWATGSGRNGLLEVEGTGGG